jgi:uncharacterized membrane protein (UPF0127 family)
MSRLDRLPRQTVLGFTVPVAATARSRLLGLALFDRDEAGEGLLIPRCRCVHTLGMRFPLDLLFLDTGGRVVELQRGVRPGRIARCQAAESVLEIPAPTPAPESAREPR